MTGARREPPPPPIVPPALTAASIELGLPDQDSVETENFRTELFDDGLSPAEGTLTDDERERARNKYAGLRRGVEYLFAALSDAWQLGRDNRSEIAALRDRANDLDGKVGVAAAGGRHAGRLALAALVVAFGGLVAGCAALFALAVLHGPALLERLRDWQPGQW